MILLSALLFGLLAGPLRAKVRGFHITYPDLRLPWLVGIAFIPQFLAFHLEPSREICPDWLASGALVGSQILLLAFAWTNRKLPGFCLLGAGLCLNFLVIVLNGGLMPISPATVAKLAPGAPIDSWQTGQRLWAGKDIVLPVTDTYLWSLSDHLLLPFWFPYQVAFSIGDILIGLGAFWALWKVGSPASSTIETAGQTVGNNPEYGD
ncbi:MAG: DUF5317 domain-containing protein [Chloroflexota bacterium]